MYNTILYISILHSERRNLSQLTVEMMTASYPNMALISSANAFLCVDTQWTFRLVWWNRTHCRGFVRTCYMTREVANCRKAKSM